MYKLVNSDTCPRPTTLVLRVLRGSQLSGCGAAQNPLWKHVAIVFFGPTPPSRISYRHLINAGHAANVYYLHGLYDVDDLERCALDEVRIG